MKYRPPEHKWEYQNQSVALDIETPPFEFKCLCCGIRAYLQERFDPRTLCYIWPNPDGCDEESHAVYEVMTT